MTIRDKNKPPTPSAPAEDDVVVIAEPAADPYTSGSNVNVPYAEATSVEAQPQGSEPDQQRIAYSTGSPPQSSIATAKGKQRIAFSTGSPPQPSIETATGSPVIRVENAPTTTATARRNNRGRCIILGCSCLTTVILLVLFVCCLLPFVVFFIILASHSQPNMMEEDDSIYGITDDFFNNDYTSN